MKKIITLFSVLLAASSFGQLITVTQNVNTTLIDDQGQVCRVNEGDVNEEEGLFLGMYLDNYFARAFDLQNDHDIEGAFHINTVSVAQGVGRNTTITINVYTANTDNLEDPALELNLVASQSFPVFEPNDQSIITATPDAVIPAGQIMVIEVFAPNSGTATNQEFSMGINNLGHTKPTYIKAADCGVATYANTQILNDGLQDYIMIVQGEENLSINQAELDKIEIFPNPVVDVVNVQLPSGMQLKNQQLIDVQGRTIPITMKQGVIEASSWASGQYVLILETDAGSLTHRLVKQ